MAAERVVDRHGQEAERDATDPCEVRGVHALDRLRHDPDAEPRDDEQCAGAHRFGFGAHSADGREHQERDGRQQRVEPQAELLRGRQRRQRP